MADRKKKKKEIPCVKCIKEAIQQIQTAKKKKTKKSTAKPNKQMVKQKKPQQYTLPQYVYLPQIQQMPQTTNIAPAISSFVAERGLSKSFRDLETQTIPIQERTMETQTEDLPQRKTTVDEAEREMTIETEVQTDIKPKKKRKSPAEKRLDLEQKYYVKYGVFPPSYASNNTIIKSLSKKGTIIPSSTTQPITKFL